MRSEVVIVAKTKMSRWSCVGGLLVNGRFVRLLNEFGYNQDEECSFEPGEIYEIEFEDKTDCRAPHVEDIYVSESKFRETFTPEEFVFALKDMGRAHFWEGSTELLFDGAIKWTHAGSGYINDENIPLSSTGFWIPDKPLKRSDYNGHVRYSYPPIRTSMGGIIISAAPGWRSLPYVGFNDPVDTIPAGTLCRVSLARWWKPKDEDVEERCHLQLSGWYDTPDETP